ncbi:MAG: ATP-binding protein [Firmicutes bacterium]|nr:ATP-binding protein [Bacillota bacterium]
MTKPLNIYALSRIREPVPFNIVEKHHAKKTDTRRTQAHEMESLRRLVDALTEQQDMSGAPALTAAEMDGFFFSYQIPHIGKEFDLLKLTDRAVLNIELKSEAVPEEQIRRQLLRNRYYLSHLDRKVRLYTVVTDSLTCYRLDMPEGRMAGMPVSKTDGDLVQVDIAEIASAVKEMAGSAQDDPSKPSYITDIDDLFRASDYLISPMETPDRFIRGEYFLTQAQERVKDLIFAALAKGDSESGGTFLHITGRPGTGKTLLLYDIARTLSETDRTLIVHCGRLREGQLTISRKMPALNIISADVLADGAEELDGYRFVLADESHRMQPIVFDKLCDSIRKNDQVCIFSSDPEQIYSAAERENNIAARIRRLPLAGDYELSERIRANKELLTFILSLKDLRYEPPEPVRYDHVELCYAATIEESQQLLAAYRARGYTFINYTRTRELDPYTAYEEDFSADQIIGREFDNVVMLMDSTFYYDEDGRLQGASQLAPDYIYPNLFYHGVSRVRERLALIVVGAPDLFDRIVEIVR